MRARRRDIFCRRADRAKQKGNQEQPLYDASHFGNLRDSGRQRNSYVQASERSTGTR
jgi:hypothetical protein